MKHLIMFSAVLLCLVAAGEEAYETPDPAEEIVLGPYLRFLTPSSAAVVWHTAEAMPSVIEHRRVSSTEIVMEERPVMEHRLLLEELGHNRTTHYRILDGVEGEALTTAYECDSRFNYTLPDFSDAAMPWSSNTLYADAAAAILDTSGIDRGYCLVYGCGEGRLAWELVRRSNLIVAGVDSDADAIAAGRNKLRETGAYGARITLRAVEDMKRLPLTRGFANLVVSETALVSGQRFAHTEEVKRLLKPGAGKGLIHVSENGGWEVVTVPPPEGAGQWTHQYGSPDNTARSGEKLRGVTSTDQLQVQWLGRPGPRAMVDRNPRKPAPLYAEGRLFTQGLQRIIAQDAYNGAILWSLEVPGFQRYNMPRDCSNWCLDGGYLYCAVDDACWRIDAGTGAVDAVIPVRNPEKAAAYEWGYIARYNDLLYGTAQRKHTEYTNFWGKNTEGWYDAPIGPVNYKVCSDALFALDPESGEKVWSYSEGLIMNPAITLADGTVFLVEGRDKELLKKDNRRINAKKLSADRWLVALDAATGKKQWERRLDYVADGYIVFYMMHAEDRLIIAASDKEYQLFVLDAANGNLLWEAAHAWTGTDHSGHMQHPTVIGNTVFLEPHGYNLASGERLENEIGRHEGCATYLATEDALIYRGTGRRISMWDPETGKTSSWTRLRPGCWLSTIAGGGMVLSPEGGGGCSCGGWMETSLAFMPIGEAE
jgi:outer membrane protein assembly factor BamB